MYLCHFKRFSSACMFLEDSAVGREVCRQSYLSLLEKVSALFPVVLQQESLRGGPLRHIAVKVRGQQRASQITLLHSLHMCVISVFPSGVFADVSAVVP